MRNTILLVLLAAVSAEKFHLGFHKNVFHPLKIENRISTLERTGKPSFKPTRSPQSSPSQAPTNSPTYSAGWFVLNQNLEDDCSVNPDVVMAVKTDVCIKSYSDDNTVDPFYVQVYCDTDYAYAMLFDDNACSELIGETNFTLGCLEDFGASINVLCTEGDKFPLSDFVDYSVLVGYGAADDACHSDDIVKIQAFKDNACLPGHGEGFESFAVVYPDVYIYPENDICNGSDYLMSTVRQPDTCVPLQQLVNNNGTWYYGETNITQGAFEYYYSDDASHPSGSVKWTASTGADDEFSITGKQNVVGILPTDFKDNFDDNEKVFAHAIASAIGNGITYEDVKITQLDLQISELRRKLSSASTDVTYKVSYQAGNLNFYTKEDSFEVLSEALIAGVESGAFTSYLQEWNAALISEGVNGDLGESSSDSVKVKYQGSPNNDDSDDGSAWAKRESANIISGVIVGIGIVVLIALGYFIGRQFSNKE